MGCFNGIKQVAGRIPDPEIGLRLVLGVGATSHQGARPARKRRKLRMPLSIAGVRKRRKQDARSNALQLPSRPAGMVSGWRAGAEHAVSKPTLSTHRA